MREFVYVVELGFGLFGAVAMVLVGWAGLSYRSGLRERGVTVLGRVKSKDTDGDGDPYLTIRYVVKGTEYLLAAYFTSGKVGDEVELLVDPQFPASAMVGKSAGTGCLLVASLLGGVLLCGVLGAALLKAVG